jgi:hypothetical protein
MASRGRLSIGFETVSKSLALPRLEALHDCAKLRVVASLVVVSEALLRIAPRARDCQIFQIVGSTVILRHNVLERCAIERCPVPREHELSSAVNALALEHGFPVELLFFECPVRRRNAKK